MNDPVRVPPFALPAAAHAQCAADPTRLPPGQRTAEFDYAHIVRPVELPRAAFSTSHAPTCQTDRIATAQDLRVQIARMEAEPAYLHTRRSLLALKKRLAGKRKALEIAEQDVNRAIAGGAR